MHQIRFSTGLTKFPDPVAVLAHIWGTWPHGEAVARAYNGGLRAEPPAGSRGRAPGQGVPIEAEALLVLNVQWKPQICPLF